MSYDRDKIQYRDKSASMCNGGIDRVVNHKHIGASKIFFRFNIFNWTLMKRLQWNFNCTSDISIEENAFENVICEMSAICLSLNVLTYIMMMCITLLNIVNIVIPLFMWHLLLILFEFYV